MHTVYYYVEIKLLASFNSFECTQYTFILAEDILLKILKNKWIKRSHNKSYFNKNHFLEFNR